MIVVDTSVWIAHFRNEATSAVAKLRAIANPNDIIVGDLILLECLQGARDEAHAAQIEAALRAFQVEDMLGDQPAVEAARLYRALRALGQTPRKTSMSSSGHSAFDAAISSCTKIAFSLSRRLRKETFWI